MVALTPSSGYWFNTHTFTAGRWNSDGKYQGRYPRRMPESGVIVVHTTESPADVIGGDSGAENVAWYFTTTTRLASYHEIVDTDSVVRFLPDDHEAWHVGAGTFNRHSWGISMGYRAHEWGRRPQYEEILLNNCAERIAEYISRAATRGINIPVEYRTAAEAAARVPGIVFHGDLQTDRSDPFNAHEANFRPRLLNKIKDCLGVADTPTPSPSPNIAYGRAADFGLIGDWDNNGTDTVGVGRGNAWYLRNSLTPGSANVAFSYGGASDIKVAGRWTGTKDYPGIYRGNKWYLRNAHAGGNADRVFSFGRAGDVPIVGDWNGNGTDTVGIVRADSGQLKWYLTNDFNGTAETSFTYGRVGDVPFVGKWLDDGIDYPGVRRGNVWHLRHRHDSGAADQSFSYGRPDDQPLVGDWNGDGTDQVGVKRGNVWYFNV